MRIMRANMRNRPFFMHIYADYKRICDRFLNANVLPVKISHIRGNSNWILTWPCFLGLRAPYAAAVEGQKLPGVCSMSHNQRSVALKKKY